MITQKQILHPKSLRRYLIWKPFLKRFNKKIAGIIENHHHRFRQKDVGMTEIGEKIAQMANIPNPEKVKLWSQFHLIENEQFSIIKLIDKLKKQITT